MNRFQAFLFRYLCPHLYVNAVTDIDLHGLKTNGFSTLLFDLDNTLLGWRSKEIAPDVKAWIEKAKTLGFKLHIVSNSFRHRVDHFSTVLGIPGIAKAIKPRKSVFLEALRTVQSKPSETAFIGDQLFTDILGGKRIGLYTILVSPVDKRELFTTEIVRIPEKIILDLFKRKNLLRNW